MLLASALMTITGCSGLGTGTSSAAETISHPAGTSAIVIQFGDYDFYGGPDVFVTGPELVVYGDGRVYAELHDGVVAGVARSRLVKGKLDESIIQDLLRRANVLPEATPVGTAAIDAGPLVLIVAGRRWDINDVAVNVFASYVEYLRAAVTAGAVEAWQPTRWITRPLGAKTCSVVEQPSRNGPYEAPVYPHAVSAYPLGTFAC